MIKQLFLTLLFTNAACAQQRQDEPNEAVKIAEEYLQEREGGSLAGLSRAPAVQDRGTYWTVEYDLDPGWMGGAPKLIIDKRTRRVIREYGEQ